MTKRALKIGFGIAFLIVGLFITIAGVALVSLVGADGRFEMPETTARSDGYALVFDAIYIRSDLPTSGSLSATLAIEVRDRDGDEIFLGVGPTRRVSRYLTGVAFDRVVRIDWPGGAGTESIAGDGGPDGPPGEQSWWEVSDQGEAATLEWTVRDGDWSVVVMNADASSEVDVSGGVEVELPILGPISVGTLIVGLLLLLVGVLMTVSGAKTPKPSRAGTRTSPGVAPPPPPPPAVGSSPPRPDA